MQSLFLLYHNWKCVQDIGLIFNLVTHKDSDSETDSKSLDFESDSSFKDNLYTKKALFKCKNGKICVLRSGAKIWISGNLWWLFPWRKALEYKFLKEEEQFMNSSCYWVDKLIRATQVELTLIALCLSWVDKSWYW